MLRTTVLVTCVAIAATALPATAGAAEASGDGVLFSESFRAAVAPSVRSAAASRPLTGTVSFDRKEQARSWRK